MPKRSRKTPPGDPRLAVAYIRVSTDRQELGPKAQLTAIKKWTAEHGVKVVRVFEDKGFSGASELEDRPGLLAALAALRAHRAGVLAVARRDRLARDRHVIAIVEREVVNAGALVAAADGAGNGTDATSELLRGVTDAMAGYERALIAARTKAALAERKAKGLRVGDIPLGSALADDGQTLVDDAREQRGIELAVKLREEGLTYRAIAKRLDEAGISTRSGSSWDPAQIRRMCIAAHCIATSHREPKRRPPVRAPRKQDRAEFMAALKAGRGDVHLSAIEDATGYPLEMIDEMAQQLAAAGRIRIVDKGNARRAVLVRRK